MNGKLRMFVTLLVLATGLTCLAGCRPAVPSDPAQPSPQPSRQQALPGAVGADQGQQELMRLQQHTAGSLEAARRTQGQAQQEIVRQQQFLQSLENLQRAQWQAQRQIEIMRLQQQIQRSLEQAQRAQQQVQQQQEIMRLQQQMQRSLQDAQRLQPQILPLSGPRVQPPMPQGPPVMPPGPVGPPRVFP